jgi:hypothetical protein
MQPHNTASVVAVRVLSVLMLSKAVIVLLFAKLVWWHFGVFSFLVFNLIKNICCYMPFQMMLM